MRMVVRPLAHFPAVEPGKVAGAVADDRHASLLRLVMTSSPCSPSATGSSVSGIQALDDELILLNVHAAAGRALAGDAGGR